MVVEAAIILPVLVIASMAFLEYSYIMQKRQQIENACRNGARVGSRLDATRQEAIDRATALMNSYHFDVVGFTIEIIDAAGVDIGDQTAWEDHDRGDAFTMRITVPYDGTSLEVTNTPIIPVPDQLVADVTMAFE
jgi:Flp pilus assembly protein TadG